MVEIPYIVGGILETDNLTSEKKFAWILKECEFFRGLSHYPDFHEYILLPLTKEVANVLGEKVDEMQCITANEVLDFLNEKVRGEILLKKAHSRRKNFVGFSAFGKEKFIHDPAFLESFYPDVAKNVEEIKGNTGYKGLVRGKVTVVITKADFAKFKDGNVLVTIQSNPSFMSVIAKASAIVADEGGIMSHAAIVSRELKNPALSGRRLRQRFSGMAIWWRWMRIKV